MESGENKAHKGVTKGLKDSRKKRDIIEVFGKTGFGKSYFTKQLIKEYNRVLIIDPMDEYKALEFDNIDDLIKHVLGHRVFRVKTTNLMDFDALCIIAQEIGNVTLVVEESQRVLPSQGVIPPEFKDLIFRGRHRAVNIILVSQRASSVNINVRSQWSRIVTFNQSEKADTDWIESTSGFDAPDLRNLAIGEYYDITPQAIERKEIPELKRLVAQNKP